MSRIWKLPISIREWVSISIADNLVTVTWPKGSLKYICLPGVHLQKSESEITVSVDSPDLNKFRWLTRTLIHNMVVWVTDGYEKKLLVLWVWYSAKVTGSILHLNLGYSHPIDHNLAEWISGAIETDPKWNIVVVVSWIDKQLVWQEAAKIRAYRKPEPYKGKGVRYVGEYIEMKAGKTAGK